MRYRSTKWTVKNIIVVRNQVASLRNYFSERDVCLRQNCAATQRNKSNKLVMTQTEPGKASGNQILILLKILIEKKIREVEKQQQQCKNHFKKITRKR